MGQRIRKAKPVSGEHREHHTFVWAMVGKGPNAAGLCADSAAGLDRLVKDARKVTGDPDVMVHGHFTTLSKAGLDQDEAIEKVRACLRALTEVLEHLADGTNEGEKN
jgi:hypothetical protein